MSQTSTGTSTGMSGLSAFFDNRADADAALNALVDAGLPRETVRIASRGIQTDLTASDHSQEETRGILERLKDLFLPAEDKHTYAEGLRRGGFLVTASNVPDNLHDEACDILEKKGAIDIEERAQTWIAEGWTGAESGPESGSESGTVEHLGASSHTGQPRMYSENAVDSLKEDPLPETPPGGTGKRAPARDRGGVRSYAIE